MSRQAPREPRVVFGFHAVLARLRADPKSVLEIFLDETRNDARAKDLAALAQRAGVHLMRVPTKRLDGFYGGGRHQGVVARVEMKNVADSLTSCWTRSKSRCSSSWTALPIRTTSAPACAWRMPPA